MKRIVLAVLGCAALGVAALPQSASASDLPARAPALMPVKAPGVLPFNWGGLYAGLNLGGGFSDVSGVVFGGQVGYNWQMGRLVFGVETDIQYSGQDDTSLVPSTIGPVLVKQELNWFGTLRGRLGYAVWDRWLPYVTGGLAYGGRTVKPVGTGFSADDTSVGWAFGVGVDYAINQAWSARLEYLHVSLDSFNPVFSGVVVNAGRLDNDIIRGAVNYKLTAY
jgi:outer membrane immunogenic protein